MASALRIEFDKAFSYSTSRGNARVHIFITDTNRVLFLDKKESASIARIKTPLVLFLNRISDTSTASCAPIIAPISTGSYIRRLDVKSETPFLLKPATANTL